MTKFKLKYIVTIVLVLITVSLINFKLKKDIEVALNVGVGDKKIAIEILNSSSLVYNFTNTINSSYAFIYNISYTQTLLNIEHKNYWDKIYLKRPTFYTLDDFINNVLQSSKELAINYSSDMLKIRNSYSDRDLYMLFIAPYGKMLAKKNKESGIDDIINEIVNSESEQKTDSKLNNSLNANLLKD